MPPVIAVCCLPFDSSFGFRISSFGLSVLHAKSGRSIILEFPGKKERNREDRRGDVRHGRLGRRHVRPRAAVQGPEEDRLRGHGAAARPERRRRGRQVLHVPPPGHGLRHRGRSRPAVVHRDDRRLRQTLRLDGPQELAGCAHERLLPPGEHAGGGHRPGRHPDGPPQPHGHRLRDAGATGRVPGEVPAVAACSSTPPTWPAPAATRWRSSASTATAWWPCTSRTSS